MKKILNNCKFFGTIESRQMGDKLGIKDYRAYGLCEIDWCWDLGYEGMFCDELDYKYDSYFYH